MNMLEKYIEEKNTQESNIDIIHHRWMLHTDDGNILSEVYLTLKLKGILNHFMTDLQYMVQTY